MPDPRPAPFVRSDARQFLDYLNSVAGPRTHELSPEAARAMFAAMPAVADLPAGDLAVMRDLTAPGPAGPIAVRVFDTVERRQPGPVVLFFHGGGFVIGSVDTHSPACAEIARALSLPVISVEYRLAPEHRWPAAPDDCEAAARWLADGPTDLGFGVTGLVLMGDSAGGNLAIVTALALRDQPAAVPVLVQAPLYPAADMAGTYPSFDEFADGYLLTRDTMTWFADAYAADLQHARTSPLQHELAGMPPAVVITAGLDPIRDQGRAYVAALAMAGVPVIFQEAAGNVHGFLNLRRAIASSQGDVAAFLAAVKAAIVSAEGARVMAQAAGA